MKFTTSGRLFFVIIAVFCGLLAGILGNLLARFYLNNYATSYLGLGSDLNLSDLNNGQNLVIRDARKVVVNQDVKTSETISSVRPALVGVFKELKDGSIDKTKPEYYQLDSPLFTGLIITADGWVAASLPANLKASFSASDFIAVSSERKVYKIDRLSDFKNLPGDLIFFHLASANNLPVKKIKASSELSLGQTVLVLNGLNKAWLTSFASFQKTTAVLSSDSENAKIILAGDISSDFSNSFVFDLAGDLVAVIDSSRKVVPAFSYNNYWQSLLQKVNLAPPYLGLNYLDLSAVKIASINLDKGALVYPSATEAAVIKNSPAALAGFKAGDIITWVDNQEINAANDLASLIANFKSGDKIILTYLRDGVEKEVEIKLGSKK